MKFPQDFKFEKSSGKLTNSLSGNYVLRLDGQAFSDFIFNTDKSTRQIYRNFNAKVVEFGQHVVNKDWDKAFMLTQHGIPTANRVSMLSQILVYIQEKFGEIKEIRCLGTIPSQNYYAHSSLSIVGEKGQLGFPIIWADPLKILGFRPMLTESLITFRLALEDENSIVGYSLDFGLSIRISIQDEGIIMTNINTDTSIQLE